MTLSRYNRYVGIIGNILGHYDTALFGLLAPFIAPLFFDKSDPLTALILTYGIMPLGIVTKPFGALFFGWVGDRFGRGKAFSYSLLAMAIVTLLMGCLPVYSQIGIWSPSLLVIGRMLQGFCAVGESTGASIFVLENSPQNQRSMMSSFYDISSMSGLFIASGLVSFFCMQSLFKDWWRLLFWIGGIPALFPVFLKQKNQIIKEYRYEDTKWGLLQVLKEYKGAITSIAIASGFSYTTYALAFTLMNGYVPLVTSLDKSDMMQINTLLLVVDMLLLPCFGYLAQKFGKERIMLIGALCSTLCAIPFFYFLNGAGIAVVTSVRFAIVFFGVAFAAPFHAWKLECVHPKHCFTILSLGCTLGSQLIGAPTSAICLWLYQQSGYIWAPGLYLMLIGLLAGLVVYSHARNENFEKVWN